MYWILAALILLPTLLVPRFRPAGLVGCAILAALLAWGVVQRWRQSDDADLRPVRGAPTTPAPQRVTIAPQLIELTEVMLTGSGAPFELRGEISNRSPEVRLRALTLQITRRDCHEAALDTSGCATIWVDRHWMNASVPPMQTRRFAVSIWPHSAVPRARGVGADEVKVISAVGEPPQAQRVTAPDVPSNSQSNDPE